MTFWIGPVRWKRAHPKRFALSGRNHLFPGERVKAYLILKMVFYHQGMVQLRGKGTIKKASAIGGASFKQTTEVKLTKQGPQTG